MVVKKVINVNKNQWNNVISNNSLCIAGPCAIENYFMMERIVKFLLSRGVSTIRAGVFKPRTLHSSFQGLGADGLEILKQIKQVYNFQVVSEIVDVRYLDEMLECVDILQVGTRNMYNYELLKELGKIRVPIILKRGLCATIKEFLAAAEYIFVGGNDNLLLCERGVRSFDNCTRNLLDLSCVAIIKKETDFPILVDISHSLGRKDIAPQVAKAALAIGADGIMVEVHEQPEIALSDSEQQMNFAEFDRFYRQVFLAR